MDTGSEHWAQTAFVRDYFFGTEQQIAHELAAHLARYYVGDEITQLRPDTDVASMVNDSVRRRINFADFTLVRDPTRFDDLDLSQSVSFRRLVVDYAEREP
ncbi:MAG: hypothetical protein AAGH76_06415 [Pseudomonadota bacterium]